MGDGMGNWGNSWQARYVFVIVCGFFLLVVAAIVSKRTAHEGRFSGENVAQNAVVSYEPRILPAPTASHIAVPKLDPAQVKDAIQLTEFAGSIPSRRNFRFSGELALPLDLPLLGVVHVRWVAVVNGLEVIGNSSVAVPRQSADGRWEYMIDMPSPGHRGRYEVRVIYLDMSVSPAKEIVLAKSANLVTVR